MILADTSIWIAHFGKQDDYFDELLDNGMVVMHPFVYGELACGGLPKRRDTLNRLNILPPLDVAADSEVIALITKNKLTGKGIGYIDAHLLAAVAQADSIRLYTHDTHLHQAAQSLSLAHRSPT
jgi:predicted nucleic acid-binding protein